jgi:hypothetical protein
MEERVAERMRKLDTWERYGEDHRAEHLALLRLLLEAGADVNRSIEYQTVRSLAPWVADAVGTDDLTPIRFARACSGLYGRDLLALFQEFGARDK